ncbi:MAG: hypothetical protein WA047_02475 [Phenylobacterium sp.]|uniref:hypothetical protein n=1 Tax=Phenylobacterium sp. TaxID=1871053 RepID=UPI003BB62109
MWRATRQVGILGGVMKPALRAMVLASALMFTTATVVPFATSAEAKIVGKQLPKVKKPPTKNQIAKLKKKPTKNQIAKLKKKPSKSQLAKLKKKPTKSQLAKLKKAPTKVKLAKKLPPPRKAPAPKPA